MLAEIGARAASALGPGSGAPQGLGSTVLFSSQPPGASASLGPGGTRIRSGRPGVYEEERIDIPGTHVPPWVVVVIVVGVILVLAATAFLFLR
jgi:hypothetical protein